MIPPTSGTETNIKLPFSFILFSIATLVISLLLFLINGESLLNGVYRIPAIWSAAHLFILGWAVCVAMGAMYQLVPVAFLVPIWSEKFGFVQFIFTAFGIVWFAYTLYFEVQSALLPGILMLSGILMFLVQMGMTLRKQAKANILTLFVGTALVCLLLTILIGITFIISMTTGFAKDIYQPLFYSHIFLGIAGWFTMLIFGFSYKMAPMFSLSHGYKMTLARYVYGFYATGLLLAIISFFLDLPAGWLLALFLLLVGFSCFTAHIYTILKKRIKKKLDRPFTFALLAILFGEIIHLLAFVLALFNQFGHFVGPIVVLYLILWIAFSIIGYLYKIVPFLWWTHRYSNVIGKEDVPALKDLINEKLALPLFIGFIVGILGVGVGLVSGWDLVFYTGQTIFTISAIVFGWAILAVLRK